MGKNERRGWTLVAIFLLFGLLCVTAAGNLAIRFAPRWTLQADMRSRLDPNSAYFTSLPENFFLPVDPAILTPPIWSNVFLTPGQIIPTRVPKATAAPGTGTNEPTQVPATIAVIASPTQTLLTFTATQTSRAGMTRTVNPPLLTATQPSSPTVTGTLKPTFTATLQIPISTVTASQTPSNTPLPKADLQITKSDGVVVYPAGGTLTYTVVVSNNGPSDVRDALVSDLKPAQISDWSWTCASQSGGASGCDPASGALDFNDQVDLPRGASIVYTVLANTRSDAGGSITNTASITPPADIPDPVTGNNSATDTDDYLSNLPYDQIGTTPDGGYSVLQPGSSMTFAFDPNTPLVVGGHVSWDLVLYEMPNGSGVAMDFIIFEISDGSNWYRIFNWGDNVPDTHSNMNINVFGGQETDNRNFTSPPNSDYLYPFNSGTPENPATGIVFDLDDFVPSGTYPYFRIISPAGSDMDGGCEVDAVMVLP